MRVDVSIVKAFLNDGAPLDDMSMLEKDDTIWLAFDGGSWREPGESDDQSSSSPRRVAWRKQLRRLRPPLPLAAARAASIRSTNASGSQKTWGVAVW